MLSKANLLRTVIKFTDQRIQSMWFKARYFLITFQLSFLYGIGIIRKVRAAKWNATLYVLHTYATYFKRVLILVQLTLFSLHPSAWVYLQKGVIAYFRQLRLLWCLLQGQSQHQAMDPRPSVTWPLYLPTHRMLRICLFSPGQHCAAICNFGPRWILV